MKRLVLFTFFSTLLAIALFRYTHQHAYTQANQQQSIPEAWLHSDTATCTPKADQRPADQTFLTFPEWYLVFSPEEQAHYLTKHTATDFPYLAHTYQIWESYHLVSSTIKGHYAPNPGYHFMIKVIGSSATVEYILKAIYEKVVGRITDTKIPLTEEDQFAAKFTDHYVCFIKGQPWYAFDFKKELHSLWTDIPLLGNHILRKAERRYFLTTELLVKWGYGKLISMGTKKIYDEALPTTSVCFANNQVIQLPRYDRFAPAIINYANSGWNVKEIAGNHSILLFTVIAPTQHQVMPKHCMTLFSQRLASDTTYTRRALVTQVSDLSEVCRQLTEQSVFVEHVFDY